METEQNVIEALGYDSLDEAVLDLYIRWGWPVGVIAEIFHKAPGWVTQILRRFGAW